MPKRKKQSNRAKTTLSRSEPKQKKQRTERSTSPVPGTSGQGSGNRHLPTRQRFNVVQARQLLLESDPEDVLATDYSDDDFDSESSDTENSDLPRLPALCTASGDGQVTWTSNTDSFSVADVAFKPTENTGPKNIPDSISSDSKPLDYLSVLG